LNIDRNTSLNHRKVRKTEPSWLIPRTVAENFGWLIPRTVAANFEL